MRGFHIDMNVAQFTRDYLEKWIRELARLGYDTLLWEVENNIRWETCPECASPDAFAKEEFRELLEMSRDLGLEPIPLLQTIAHCEYVLKHEQYRHLAEVEGEISQYCPRNPDLLPFLKAWIEEYLEVFAPVRRFHLGADEAWWLGRCERCSDYLRTGSLADLYVEHINAVSEPLRERNITPVIWADMLLHHHEGLSDLSDDFVLFDWAYNVHRGDGRVQVWGEGLCYPEEIPCEAAEVFGEHLFPRGDEPGRTPETFYTADFLAERGFRTVTCPTSSSYGDNVFSPRHWYHLVNTYDSFRKGGRPHLRGSLLTSWTVHLHPWELQLACIAAPSFLGAGPSRSLPEYQRYFVQRWFGSSNWRCFFHAAGLLSKSCLFTHTASLGFGKNTLPVDVEHARRRVGDLQAEDRIHEELGNCGERLQEYQQALAAFEQFSAEAGAGHHLLERWKLAARNLINRAQASALLLERAEQQEEDVAMSGEERSRARQVLSEMQSLKEQTRELYSGIYRPTRCDEAIAWMFDSVEHALTELVAE